MAKCPKCRTDGAYVGFSSIECRNPDCEHYVIVEELICPCCGSNHKLEDCATALSYDVGLDLSVKTPDQEGESKDDGPGSPHS
jgi:hypothetical protein